jgi:thioesterase domain-containing protein/acyl carrier protein
MTDVPDNISNLSAAEQKELLVGLLSQMPERVFPLSLAQQRLWFLDRLHPGNPAYNVPFGLRLRGNLNRSALESSIRALIQRHEILRTHFEIDSGRPVQVVAADSAIEIHCVDLASTLDNDRQLEVQRIAREEARLSFNLATGPLVRVKLIRLAAEEHLVLCVMHHIVCDGWSLEIFGRELAALYAQYSGAPCASLADLPIQYGDYAKWQLEWIACDLLADQAQYWKRKLAGAPAFLRLPIDFARPPEQTFDGASQAILIPPHLVHNLADFGRTQRATLFMVMLAVFKTLLHCYTRADDILVGVPVAGRNRFELEDLVGFFVNTLVLRSDLSGDPYFIDFLRQVREVSLDAFAHADLPFEKLVEELNPERTLSYSPVIQVMFSAIKARQFPNLGDISTSPYIFDSRTSLFDVSMEFIEDAEDCYWLRVEYDTSLFGPTRMKGMLDDYLTLLRAIAAQPELCISRLTSLLKVEGDAATRNRHIPNDQEADRAPVSRRNLQGPSSKETPEPRDALEQILVRVWERVLGVSKIRICDNFFDLGGHSLLAAQLVSEIEKITGCKLPLSALFRSSTIESLAEVIRHGTEWSPDPLLMELNAGTQGVPLFAIVQSGVDALGYGLLARHMGTEQPVYKLQAHAPTCHIVPFSIEEFRTIAREYVAAMRAIQPKGPYCLLGMCNGVHIAEQMVLELEDQGLEVGLFGIIDTFVLQYSEIRWLARIEAFRVRRRHVSQLPLLAQASHYKVAIKNRLRRLLLHETEPFSPWTKAVWPGKEFQPKKFHAPVILFKRTKQPYFKVKDRDMGWAQRSLSPIEICTFTLASHDEMLREPAVQAIAEQLKDRLSHIEKGDSRYDGAMEPSSVMV